MKQRVVLAVLFFLPFISAISQSVNSEDSIEYSVVEGIVERKFGVFVIFSAEEWDDAPYKNLEVELMANIDKSDSKSGISGWQPIVTAKVVRCTKAEVEVELLQDVITEAAKKGITFTIKKGQKIRIRWPEISY